MFPTALALTGVLVTYSHGAEIGRERYTDDGKILRSEISMAGRKATVTLQRSPRQAVVTQGDVSMTREIPPGVLALENGHWEAYALAAEQYPDAHEPTAVKVMLPGGGQILDGKLKVTPRPDKGRHLELSIGMLTVEVDLAPNGAVTRAAVPLQGVEVRPEGAPAPQAARRTAPEGIVEEPIEITRSAGKLRGVLWRPKESAGKPPIVVFIVGSGPTDRDGNSTIGLFTDCYRMLAEALARGGVASIRYDKRGIGASDPFDEAGLSLDEYAGDAGAFVSWARKDGRFGKLTVLGHSEGGLVAIALAQKLPLDGLVLISTAGRPLWQVLHEQLARKADAAKLAQLDEILGALRDGKPVKTYPADAAALFRPSMEKLWRSELPVDPAALLGKLELPVTIVQGESDLQVSVEDARRLAAARKDAHLALLPRVNHVLKEEAAPKPPQASYTDASRPLGPGVAETVKRAVAR